MRVQVSSRLMKEWMKSIEERDLVKIKNKVFISHAEGPAAQFIIQYFIRGSKAEYRVLISLKRKKEWSY